ncbi:MAG: type IV pilus assembly protein PilM [Candidatus Omnitrophica bacterium]|nr:type IV pilus assembly protein PilM [Candidatus Omnitrophota bacterium]
MLNKFRTSQKTCLGVDIGSYSLKVVEASLGQEQINLTKVAIRELPPEYTENNIATIFKDLAEEGGFQAHDVRLSLSGPNVTVRFINMPHMSLQDLKNSLKYEADQYIPFNIDEVVTDCCILSKANENEKQMRVLLAAAKKNIVNRRIDLFKGLGYSVRLIDVDGFALFNCFSRVAESDVEKSISLVNIGHRYTNVIVARGGSPYFSRDIRMGGEEILKIMADQSGISEKEVKQAMSGQGEKDEKVTEIIKGVLNNLAEEIRLSFGYYENQFGRSVDQIFLSGGWAEEKTIAPHFAETLGITPILWDPLKGATLGDGVDKDRVEPMRASLAVCCGLVARKA